MGGLISGKVLVLLAVGLIVLGPERLPELARTLGRLLSEVRRVSTDLRQEVNTAFGADVANPVQEFRAAADSLRSTATSWVTGPAAGQAVASDGTVAGPAGAGQGGGRTVGSAVLVPEDELAFPPGDPSLN